MKMISTILLLTACLFAQDKPKPEAPLAVTQGGGKVKDSGVKQLTPEEKNSLSRAEVRSLRAGAGLQAAQQENDAANAQMNAAINAIYGERKIQIKDYALCENPAPGPCERAPAGDLTLQPVKRAEEKK